jgi:uncharacterized protein YndB with AHSA1/START domain
MKGRGAADGESQGKTRVIRMRRRLIASPERVYRAWADPEELARWLPDQIEGGLAVGTQSALVWADRRETWYVVDAQPNKTFVFIRSSSKADKAAPTTSVRIEPLGYGSRIEIEVGPFPVDSDDGLDSWGEALQTWAEALAMLRAHLDFSIDLRVRE